ncbi:MAG TPA: hypothetical protein PLS49_08485, partial [Candidatus Woesebacteria bacterium]|nr:hypothetical protein [Candidatus Woesebacteria bacterium]
PLDKNTKGDRQLGIECRDVDMYEDPLSAIIRFADNLDIGKTRFIGVQNEEAFKLIYYLYGDNRLPESQLLYGLERHDADIIEKVTNILETSNIQTPITPDTIQMEYKMLLAKKILKEQYSSLSDDIKAQVLEQIQYLDTKQLRHWGGSDVIEDVMLQGPTLTITVDGEKFKKFQEIPVIEIRKDNNGNEQMIELNVAIYQIWRAHLAYAGLNMGENRRVQFIVKDTQNNLINIPDITESFFD